jgi:UDP-GlcNAc:undecaprenyl-phosphate GlcNAc-1-phosphate transferase
MIINYKILISVCLSLITLILISYRKKFEKRYNFLDNPAVFNRKIHKKLTSNIGGLACLIPFLIAISLSFVYENLYTKKFLIISFLSSSLLFFLGKIDDDRNIRATKKIFLLIAFFFLLYTNEPNLIVNIIQFKYHEKKFFLSVSSVYFTFFCLFIFYNTCNFIDGYNGIFASLIIFWILYLIIFSKLISIILLTLLFSLIIFLYFNLRNIVFIGNSGNIFISYFVGSYFIYDYNSFQLIFCDEIFLLFLIPGIDTVRVVIERLIKRKSPFLGDKIHIHHLLESKVNEKYLWIIILLATTLPIIFLKLLENFILTIFIGFFIYYLLYKFSTKLR